MNMEVDEMGQKKHSKVIDGEITEELAPEQVMSIIESILFSTDRPQSLTHISEAFKGTQVTTPRIKKAIESLKIEYASGFRGITLEEVSSGFQLRTKVDNGTYIKRMMKVRSFRLSGPALEVLSIVAYKQPCIKATVDEIRGVESGHLFRSLMDRGMVNFTGKSELSGKPMLYGTTRKFLETFGLRNLKELPSLAEIDDLLPEGMDAVEEKEETLLELAQGLSEDVGKSYSQGEEELARITDELGGIDTSSEFFEQEKQRMKAKKEAEKAEDIREAMAVGEEVSTRDHNWLARYDLAQVEQN